MCVLRIVSKKHSLRSVFKGMDIPVLSITDSGEYRDKAKKRLNINNDAALDVSEKEWNEPDGQIEDAISFLIKYSPELKYITKQINDVVMSLDFPISSVLGEEWVTQGINFPRELISIAGKLGIGIGMTLYAKELFDDLLKN